MITIIDYGAGNLKSVANALDFLKVENKISSDPADILSADKIILPGVGNFGDLMASLKSRKLIEPIKNAISSGKPYLGMCLGLQALFESSEESPGVLGLCVFKGKVKKFKSKTLKIPQIGWNSISIKKESALLSLVKSDSYFYFVHSYYVVPKDKSIILSTTEYGTEFVSSVAYGNVYATQFHPEKSGSLGLKVLSNFVNVRSVDAVLFDMDGVLVDSHDAWYNVFNTALEKQGKAKVSVDEFDCEVWGKDIGRAIDIFFHGEDIADLAKRYTSYFPKHVDSVHEISGTIKTLKELKRQGIKLGIVTNSFKSIAKLTLKKCGLAEYFDIIISGDDVSCGKPNPEGIELCLKKLGVSPLRSIYIGDTSVDIKAGVSAGCKTVAFRFGHELRIDNLYELIEMI